MFLNTLLDKIRHGIHLLLKIDDHFHRIYAASYGYKDGESLDVGGATWNVCQNIAFGHQYVNGREDSQGNGSIVHFDPSYCLAQNECAPTKAMHDSDSIGAVFGQIARAYYGFNAIPERWVKAIKTLCKVDDLIARFLDTLRRRFRTIRFVRRCGSPLISNANYGIM